MIIGEIMSFDAFKSVLDLLEQEMKKDSSNLSELENKANKIILSFLRERNEQGDIDDFFKNNPFEQVETKDFIEKTRSVLNPLVNNNMTNRLSYTNAEKKERGDSHQRMKLVVSNLQALTKELTEGSDDNYWMDSSIGCLINSVQDLELEVSLSPATNNASG